MTTAENYLAVKSGHSALQRYEGLWSLPEPFCASLFTDSQRQVLAIRGLTRFESLVVHSVREALSQCPELDIAANNVVFILSTTKADLEQPLPPPTSPLRGRLVGATAQRIARELGFTTTPIVVCNACISGVAAVILAKRLLESGNYDYAVVCGADVQNRFTVSGFQSLKAVAAEVCRPFDMERTGLNLGEAAATMVMSSGSGLTERGCHEIVEAGAIRNDAYHISSPSKNAEGACLALTSILNSQSSIAFINAHGTATMFNDQMESVAIERAGLGDIPVNGLKGYYGHTLGAAGVLETIISIAALRDHTVLATHGFAERGVSGKIKVTAENAAAADGTTSFVKMISGFGGGNAAIMVTNAADCRQIPVAAPTAVSVSHHVVITPATASVDGQMLPTPPHLTDLYKHYVGDYPKFYKMDGLSRLGFLASELLLQAERKERGTDVECSTANGLCSMSNDSRAVVLFNSSSSTAADRKYLETIAPDNFFPSPSLFVYTLPNIVTGEIAIRNGYHGETSFFILPWRDESLMNKIVLSTFQDRQVKSIITGWLDYYDETRYEADLILLTA